MEYIATAPHRRDNIVPDRYDFVLIDLLIQLVL